MNLGAMLRCFRKDANLSIVEVCTWFDMTPAQLLTFEHGGLIETVQLAKIIKWALS